MIKYDIGHEPALEPREKEPVLYCDQCGGGIYDNDAYYEIGGHTYCEACIADAMNYAEGY